MCIYILLMFMKQILKSPKLIYLKLFTGLTAIWGKKSIKMSLSVIYPVQFCFGFVISPISFKFNNKSRRPEKIAFYVDLLNENLNHWYLQKSNKPKPERAIFLLEPQRSILKITYGF